MGTERRRERAEAGVKARIRILCGALERTPALEDQLAAAGATGVFERLRVVVAGRQLDVEATTVLLDEIDEAAMATLALDGLTTGSKGYRPVPEGLAGPEPVAAWTCPHVCCGRVVMAGEANIAPLCRLGPQPLPMAEYRT